MNGTRGGIAFFLPSLVGGGAERVFVDLANHFSSQGLPVAMICARLQGELLPRLHPEVRRIDLGVPRILSSLLPLWFTLRRHRFEVVFSAMTHANVVLLLAGRLLAGSDGRVVVQEVARFNEGRNLRLARQERLVCWLAERLYHRADAVLAISDLIVDELQAGRAKPLKNVVVLPNPVDLERIRRLGQEPPHHPWLGDGDSLPVIMGMGRLAPEKDFATLIRAFARLQDSVPSRLILVGEGAGRVELQRLVQSLGLADRVAMPGFLDNPYGDLARCRLFVLSSVAEGFSLALAEALALGRPVVVTACGEPPLDMVGRGRYGAVVPVGDVEAMARAMAESLSRKWQSTELSARVERYGIDPVARQYRKILWGD
ncbi:MAG: glycosyltransferase [Magnetococcales bacterium]|nr:glycosyltransferase [Magnetococcales bacterium]